MVNGIMFRVAQCETCLDEQPCAYNHTTHDWTCWFCCERRNDVKVLPEYQRDHLQSWYAQASAIFAKHGSDASGEVYNPLTAPRRPEQAFWDRAMQGAGPVDIDAGYHDDDDDEGNSTMPRPRPARKEQPAPIPGWVYQKDETSNITQDVSDEAMSFLERALEGMPDTTKYVLGKLGEST
jgi:hypothetical protein